MVADGSQPAALAGARPTPVFGLCMAALLLGLLYLMFDAYVLLTRGLFNFIGVDYRSFWASAQISQLYGFAQVYDLDLQRQLQEPLALEYAHPEWDLRWATVPTPYFPIFVAFFRPFLLLPPDLGFAVFTVLNVLGAAGYLVWFQRQIGAPRGWTLLPALLLAFPALENFQFGQVNTWLMISLGEFLRRATLRQDLGAGIWLAGLLLKPQALMMLGPGLFLARRWRMLIGLAIGSAGVLGLSALVGGVDGLVAQAELLYRYPGEMPSTQPRDMMNWRAVAVHLSAVLPGAVAWSLAMIGLLVTFMVGLGLWLDRRAIETPEGFTIAVLGTYAATAAVAWHAHTHMLLGLSAPMLFLAARGAIPLRVLGVWFLGPHLIFMVLRVGFDLGNTGVIAVNLYLLGWAILELRRRSTALRSQGAGPAWSREAILPAGQS